MALSHEAYGLQKTRARAKINLTLHVGRAIDDPQSRYHGYHPLNSLVVFADIGDNLAMEASPNTRLTLQGPYSAGLASADLASMDDNLILKAARRVYQEAERAAYKDQYQDMHFAFDLVKNLPIASGIGGGSADAAAALRLLSHYYNFPDETWMNIAEELGADIPVCFPSKTTHMCGIGENLTILTGLGQCDAVLVNPNKALSTAKIFTAYDARLPPQSPAPQAKTGDLLSRALSGTNDLQPVAISLCPDIDRVLSALEHSQDCQLARMSGSGASCFGLFPNSEDAQLAAQQISQNHPDWWVQPCKFG